jgi:hypothetical protein
VGVVVLSATDNAAETLMADTINTGTMLIEEGALLPESLRLESEPWTFFYMAGEIIRELRKASGKQSKYGSEGNMAHSGKVIDRLNPVTAFTSAKESRQEETITSLSVATILNR